MTNSRRFRDTCRGARSYFHRMAWRKPTSIHERMSLDCLFILILAVSTLSSQFARAQNTPLLSGGAGFLTQTSGGDTTYIPTITPVLEFPLSQRFLIESKANLLEFASPKPHQGYDTQRYVAIAYLQGDLQATAHATITCGYFYTPFNTFNERLSPIWINNFSDGPIISSIGIGSSSGSSLGGMLRGNAYQNRTVSVTYDAYLGTRSSSEQFSSMRMAGERISFFFPDTGIEVGTSFNRVLQSTRRNNTGLHLWWTPPESRFRFRSEYAHTTHVQGYWVEFASQLTTSPESARPLARFEPVFRYQQTFRNAPDKTDGLPSANTQRADFGLDYRLPHEVRISTSYSRRFSSSGNTNIWQTGLVYRFLFPAWRSQ